MKRILMIIWAVLAMVYIALRLVAPQVFSAPVNLGFAAGFAILLIIALIFKNR